ncbi:sigma-70 family RNA polymerase sigma factor [Microbacterium sp.]|uniref:sigma-70 family RNA polymerase sigma factor n=1 Tax=Microbacterium sp. TaxID=51671 RepID=UPI0039E5F552
MDDASDVQGSDSDTRLLQKSRAGDRHAFSELWRRHAPVAVAYARSLGAAPPDPEDVVADSFVSILRQLRAGKGPQRSFRPYLLTTVKNTWMTDARRAPRTTTLDETTPQTSTIGAIDVDSMADASALTEAFHSLPERWQHALWLSEVEQLPPREIATVLHIRPNSAAALTYRARDALRKAWIRAHLRTAPEGTDHARVIELLGSYAQNDLSPRSERFVAAHLHDCPECRSAAGEARQLAKAMSFGPLLAGGAGLVIAPALFPADQAAAAVASVTNLPTWAGLTAAAQPVAEAATHASPLLWPTAAASALALSVSGSLLALPVDDQASDSVQIVAAATLVPPTATSAAPSESSASPPTAQAVVASATHDTPRADRQGAPEQGIRRWHLDQGDASRSTRGENDQRGWQRSAPETDPRSAPVVTAVSVSTTPSSAEASGTAGSRDGGHGDAQSGDRRGGGGQGGDVQGWQNGNRQGVGESRSGSDSPGQGHGDRRP